MCSSDLAAIQRKLGCSEHRGMAYHRGLWRNWLKLVANTRFPNHTEKSRSQEFFPYRRGDGMAASYCESFETAVLFLVLFTNPIESVPLVPFTPPSIVWPDRSAALLAGPTT